MEDIAAGGAPGSRPGHEYRVPQPRYVAQQFSSIRAAPGASITGYHEMFLPEGGICDGSDARRFRVDSQACADTVMSDEGLIPGGQARSTNTGNRNRRGSWCLRCVNYTPLFRLFPRHYLLYAGCTSETILTGPNTVPHLPIFYAGWAFDTDMRRARHVTAKGNVGHASAVTITARYARRS